MKKLDRLMQHALDAAEAHLAVNGQIAKEYNGYISSFGARVRTGLKPAIAAFENKNSDAARDRTKLMEALLQIIRSYRGHAMTPSTLMNYVLTSPNYSLVRQDIMDAATALKLAIRTFELV